MHFPKRGGGRAGNRPTLGVDLEGLLASPPPSGRYITTIAFCGLFYRTAMGSYGTLGAHPY